MLKYDGRVELFDTLPSNIIQLEIHDLSPLWLLKMLKFK